MHAFTRGCARKPAVASWRRRDVAPIPPQPCANCHVPGQPDRRASGFDRQGCESLMRILRSGPVVLPGDPMARLLVMRSQGRVDPSIKMPKHGTNPGSPDA